MINKYIYIFIYYVTMWPLSPDINLYISSFLEKKEKVELNKVCKILHKDLYDIPYNIFKFNFYYGYNLKTFINHTKGIEELEIEDFDIFQYIIPSLPKLKKLKIKNCSFDTKLLQNIYPRAIITVC